MGNRVNKAIYKTKKTVSRIISRFKFLIVGAIVILLGILLLVIIQNVTDHPVMFLIFANKVKNKLSEDGDTSTYAQEYQSYWGAICTEGDNKCTDEKIKASEKVLKEQKKFLKAIDKLKVSEKQKTILMATAYYGYDIVRFNEDEGAFKNEEESTTTDEGMDSSDLKNERKTLKHLAKGFGDSGSEEDFYNFLITDDYLDDKPVAKSKYESYRENYDLPKDYKDWDDKDREAVRSYMVDEIKRIVNSYDELNSEGEALAGCFSGEYWLPIGSQSTEEKNGATFATGSPSGVRITSHAFARDSAHQDHDHGGTDFATDAPLGTENIIASVGGTVISANDSCPSNGSLGNRCGGGFGNYVYVQDAKGYVEIYGHMASGTVKVKEGDTVSQGQVLGKMGSSGSSTGTHLHFEMHDESGNKVDPEDYVSIENPRPSGDSSTCAGGFVSGENNVQSVCLSLKQYGLSDDAIAGIMTNIQIEGQFYAACEEAGGGGGYGIVQWTGSRRTDLFNALGSNASDLGSQIDYMMKEVETGYPNNYKYLHESHSASEQVEYWCLHYEVAGGVSGSQYIECPRRAGLSDVNKFKEYASNNCSGYSVVDTGYCQGGQNLK